MREKDSEQEHRREGNDTTLRELVTVRTFRLPSEAMLAKAMLDSAGIECFVADNHAASILGSDVTGIRVQVNRIDAGGHGAPRLHLNSRATPRLHQNPVNERESRFCNN